MSPAVIHKPQDSELEFLAALLRSGEVVAIPTETVYGLAGDALNPAAAAKIFAAKERPTFDPLIVHLTDIPPLTPFQSLRQSGLVDFDALPSKSITLLEELASLYWPGPLTLVLPKTSMVPDLITAGLPSVAIRFPAHPVARKLLRLARTPLAAPSANRFGRISPTSAQAVFDELHDRIGHILDGGPCEIGVESTVVRVAIDGSFELLRPGKITETDLRKILGDLLHRASSRLDEIASARPMEGPGMLASHYAPRKDFFRAASNFRSLSAEEAAKIQHHRSQMGPPSLLMMNGNREQLRATLSPLLGGSLADIEVLSPKGSAEEAAQRLFEILRRLDAAPSSKWILGELPSSKADGLWHAIRDRLMRASRELS